MRGPCRNIERRLSEYLDGQLGAPQRAAVEAHVKECCGCATTLRAMRLGVDALRGMKAARVSDTFHRRLRERLPPTRPRLWQRWTTSLLWGRGERQRRTSRRLAVTAVGVTVLAASWFGLNRPQEPRVESQYVQRCAERHSLYLAHQPLGDSLALSAELVE